MNNNSNSITTNDQITWTDDGTSNAKGFITYPPDPGGDYTNPYYKSLLPTQPKWGELEDYLTKHTGYPRPRKTTINLATDSKISIDIPENPDEYLFKLIIDDVVITVENYKQYQRLKSFLENKEDLFQKLEFMKKV